MSTHLFIPSAIEFLNFKKDFEKEDQPEYSIPVKINSTVISFINAFQNKKFEVIQKALNRSLEFIDQFKEIFRKHGLPQDLAYLPLIESGFRVNAVSRARATGMWQFMSSTARLFGLRVDWIVDERKDPYKSAAAAARYLKQLHGKFGDWYLALASYNGGPGRIHKAVRRLKTKDFFKIARTRYLRRETRNYIPAFIASLLIMKSPEKYGFFPEPAEEIFAETKKIKIISPASLKKVSALIKVPYSSLKKINPELTREFTPFNQKHYYIRVPEKTDETKLLNLKRLSQKSKYFAGWYRVKKGDSLYRIARRFGTSVKKIKSVNKLRSNLIRPGKRLLIPRGIH